MKEWLASVARLLGRALPDRALARLLPRGLRWDPAEVEVARAPHGRVRLLISPANSAGQGYAWARAAERHLADVGAVNLMVRSPAMARFGFAADAAVAPAAFVLAGQWQREQTRELERRFSHLLLESGRFPCGSVPFRKPHQVVEDLVGKGVRVALLWHGSDIRVPSEHAASEPDSPFGSEGTYPAESAAVLERNARANRRFVESTDLPVFVSTPGLLDVPRSRWLPVVVDPDRWAAGASALERDRPVVAYAPSNSPMKGDESIDRRLRALEAEGVIEYRPVEAIPSGEMPDLFRGADIVLDQFRLGDYGVAACEAMAAGRVVIGHVSDIVRRHVAEQTGRELPIVESRLDAVEATVREVVSDRDRYRRTAAEGPAFVRHVHDGARSAEVLAGFLGAVPRDA